MVDIVMDASGVFCYSTKAKVTEDNMEHIMYNTLESSANP